MIVKHPTRWLTSWPTWKRNANGEDMPKKKKPQPPTQQHGVSYKALGGHSDAYVCSCGWESQGYWDLREAAWDEWLLHAFDSKTPVEAEDIKRQHKLVQERGRKNQQLLNQREAIDRQLERMKPWRPT